MAAPASIRALELLENQIQQQPDQLKPIFQQILAMFKSSMIAFDTHIVDNDNLFNQISVLLVAQAERITSLEARASSVTSDGDKLVERISKCEDFVKTVDAKVDVAGLDGAKTAAAVADTQGKINVIHDVVNAMAADIHNKFQEVKSNIDHIGLVVEAGSSGGSSDVVATRQLPKQ